MHVRLATIDDAPMVASVMRHESIWPYVTDDNCLDAPEESVVETISAYIETQQMPVLVLMDDDRIAGSIFIHPINTIMCELHTAVLPEYRGEKAVCFMLLVKEWLRRYSSWKKVITLVRSGNLPARALAIRMGMSKEGTITNSFLWRGMLHDQYLYGINL